MAVASTQRRDHQTGHHIPDLTQLFSRGEYCTFYDANHARRTMKVDKVYPNKVRLRDPVRKNRRGHYIRKVIDDDHVLGRYDRRRKLQYAMTAKDCARLLLDPEPRLYQAHRERIYQLLASARDKEADNKR